VTFNKKPLTQMKPFKFSTAVHWDRRRVSHSYQVAVWNEILVMGNG
jgi:hypothetical protein